MTVDSLASSCGDRAALAAKLENEEGEEVPDKLLRIPADFRVKTEEPGTVAPVAENRL